MSISYSSNKNISKSKEELPEPQTHPFLAIFPEHMIIQFNLHLFSWFWIKSQNNPKKYLFGLFIVAICSVIIWRKDTVLPSYRWSHATQTRRAGMHWLPSYYSPENSENPWLIFKIKNQTCSRSSCTGQPGQSLRGGKHFKVSIFSTKRVLKKIWETICLLMLLFTAKADEHNLVRQRVLLRCWIAYIGIEVF